MDSNLKLKLRKNILTKKQIEKMNDFYDVIDVYNAQTDHRDFANDKFFNNLQEKISAQSECKQLQLTNTFGFDDGSNDGIVGIDEELDDDQKKEMIHIHHSRHRHKHRPYLKSHINRMQISYPIAIIRAKNMINTRMKQIFTC
eukprot:UN04267